MRSAQGVPVVTER